MKLGLRFNLRTVVRAARNAAMAEGTQTYVVKNGDFFEWGLLCLVFFKHPDLAKNNMVAMFDSNGVDALKEGRHGNR